MNAGKLAARALHSPAVVAILAATLLFAAPTADAHRLNVFASIEGETLIVETRFSNGGHPRRGQLTVFDGDERPLLTQPLDGKAVQRLPAPGSLPLTVEVELDDSHYGRWTIPAP